MSDPKNYTVAWICAINTEYVAAQAFLDEKHEGPEYLSPQNKNDYTLGRIGKHNIVISVLPMGEYGTSSAARVAEDMMHSFPNIRIGLMVGIGGGAPSLNNDIRLGDIVVSIPSNGQSGVIQYDFGKTIQGQSFQPTGFLDQPPTVLRAAVNGLRAQYEIDGHRLEEAVNGALERKPRLRKRYMRPDIESDRLYRSHVIHPPENESTCAVDCGDDLTRLVFRNPRSQDEDNPAIHYGLIASANQLMKDALIRDRVVAEKGVLCFEMEAAGLMNHFPCLVIRGICDYSDSHKSKEWQGYAAMVAVAYAKDLLYRIIPQQVEREERILDILGPRIDHMAETTDRIDRNVFFDRLPNAQGAEFNSYIDQHEGECLPGTRSDILHQIREWAFSPHGKCIFWLNGMAGTGKSTISRTVAKSLQEAKQLGASFFFKRGEGDRGNAKKLFPTIARQLVVSIPQLRLGVQKAISDDSSLAGKSLKEQFDKLILQPLLSLEQLSKQTPTVVVVMDALDECDVHDDIRVILQLLPRLQGIIAVHLRIFLTSRPDLPIWLGFSKIRNQDYQDLVLHDVPEAVTAYDISLFLNWRLSKIRKDRSLPIQWPGSKDIQALVKISVPLFIFAATACRVLEDPQWDPADSLAEILTERSEGSQMSGTYLPVLNQLIKTQNGKRRRQLIQEFQEIVGTIVTLESPLSITSLSKLIGVSVDRIDVRLTTLHSVIQVPEDKSMPVRPFHLSFRDFLLDPETREKTPLWVNGKEIHQRLASQCLDACESLRRNLCGLPSPGTERANISRQTINQCLPPELQYACRYWASHLVQCTDLNDMMHDALKFLQRHFLHWVEAMSLLGLLSELLEIIDLIQASISVSFVIAMYNDSH
jgi:nucleoside phosphorylase